MARKQNTYSQEYKFLALKMVKKKGLDEAAEQLGIPKGTICSWIYLTGVGCQNQQDTADSNPVLELINEDRPQKIYIAGLNGEKTITREEALRYARLVFQNAPKVYSDIEKALLANSHLEGVFFPTCMLGIKEPVPNEVQIHRPCIEEYSQMVDYVYDGVLLNLLTDMRICGIRGWNRKKYLQMVQDITNELLQRQTD